MKCLCIYVTYDSENIVDDYIGYMLQNLRKVVDYMVVVCNYSHVAYGLENLQPYADRIFYRENMGFDVGAYKDVLCQYLGWDVILTFDKLLLVNDSFFGPFYTFENLFSRMEKIDVDYWGMTSCPETELDDGYTYESHIQSYFLLLGNRILNSREFRTFWEDMTYPVSFTQAIITFEIGINKFLQELGFIGTTVMDQCPVPWKLDKNENPHILYPLELIRDAKIPVLKRKSLVLENKRFDDAIGALRFIKNECSYDISLIENHLRRTGKGANIMGIDEFYASHPRIYIYGAGVYGKNIAEYFAYKEWTFEKFLVTDLTGQLENCIPFAEADIAKEDGIIIAIGDKKAFLEIVQVVRTRCGKDQIYNPDNIIQ